MDTLSINFLAVAVGAVVSMVIGALWYGPIFGKQWMVLIGVDLKDPDATKKMRKSAGPLYLVQFLLSLFQVMILAQIIADTTRYGGLNRALWIWAAFVIPALAGAVMWTNEATSMKWKRFLIQGGYQLVMFVVFGLLLHYWK